jgi:hypothetical protein
LLHAFNSKLLLLPSAPSLRPSLGPSSTFVHTQKINLKICQKAMHKTSGGPQKMPSKAASFTYTKDAHCKKMLLS